MIVIDNQPQFLATVQIEKPKLLAVTRMITGHPEKPGWDRFHIMGCFRDGVGLHTTLQAHVGDAPRDTPKWRALVNATAQQATLLQIDCANLSPSTDVRDGWLEDALDPTELAGDVAGELGGGGPGARAGDIS